MDLTLISPHGYDCHSDGNVLVFRTPGIRLPDHRLLRFRRLRIPSENQFWLYDFETLHNLPEGEFRRIKFGDSFDTILAHFERPDAVDIYPPTLLPAHHVATWDFQESIIRFFDASSNLITELTPEPPGYGLLYSVALDGEDFWAAFPEVALFDEPVWEYLHVGKRHIIKLQSGIYIVHF